MLKKNSKLFIGILIGIFLTSTSVFAANVILAKNINFTPENDSWNVSNVDDALNYLYSKKNNITYIDSDRTSYNIPNGVKKVYIVIERATSNVPYTITFSGSSIISRNLVSTIKNVDVNLAIYREIYELNLDGNGGKISLTRSGGSAASQAWSSFVLY